MILRFINVLVKLPKRQASNFIHGYQLWYRGRDENIPAELYAVNGNGESAYEKPAYVDHYTFFVSEQGRGLSIFVCIIYQNLAALPEVDGIHLDYIRFPDVILAKGLWKKLRFGDG